MRKQAIILLSLVLVGLLTAAFITERLPAEGIPGAPGVGDPYFPGLGNGGYDALHYELDVQVNLDEAIIESRATIQARAIQNLSRFNLDFAGMTIHSLTVNGTDATFARQGRELIITPSQVLPEGAVFETVVVYSGTPGKNVEGIGSPYSRGWIFHENGVYVVSEPDGSSLWYPVNDHPSDKADYTLHITVDSDYTVAANGELIETVAEGNRTRYTWDNDEPTASYLVTVNIGALERVNDGSVDGVALRNYFPVQLIEDATGTFSNQADMLRAFNRWFGAYPFQMYGSVVADVYLPFALETQTLSLYGSGIVNSSGEARDRSDMVISHELAHSWFGNSVSPSTWRDIWLNEGFATYASFLWLYDHDDSDENALTDYMDSLYNLLPRQGLRIGDPGARNLFNRQVYMRGAWTLHALRLEIGDEMFFELLQTYHEQFKHGDASIPEFIALAESISGHDLAAFFDAWLYQQQLPPKPGT